MAAATVSLASPKPIHSPLNLPDPRLDLHFGGTSPTSSSFTTGTSTSTSAVPRASSSASGIATGGARGQRSGSVGTAGRSSMDSPRTDGFNSKTSSSPRPQAVGPSGVVSPSSSGSSFGSAKEKTPGSALSASSASFVSHNSSPNPGPTAYPFPASAAGPPPPSPSQQHPQPSFYPGPAGYPSSPSIPLHHPLPHHAGAPQHSPFPLHPSHPHHQQHGPPSPQMSQMMMQAYQQQQQHFQHQMRQQQQQHYGPYPGQPPQMHRTPSGGAPAGVQWGPTGPFVTGPPHLGGISPGPMFPPNGASYPGPPSSQNYPYHPHHHRPRPSVGGSESGSSSPSSSPHPMYIQHASARGSSSSINSTRSGAAPRPVPPVVVDPARKRAPSGSSDARPPLMAMGDHNHHVAYPNARQRTESEVSSVASSVRSQPPSSPSSLGVVGRDERSPTPRGGGSSAGGAPSIASSATTVNTARKPSPLAQTVYRGKPIAHVGAGGVRTSLDDESIEENGSSETTSETERKPGHRSTPGTSVDSTASANKPGAVGTAPVGMQQPSAADRELRAATLSKHGLGGTKSKSLSNKLRKALSMQAMAQSERDANEGSFSSSDEQPRRPSPMLASSAASIAGVPSAGSASVASGGRRLGFLRGANSSTDNLSISSTVSSASVMIRKLGNMGRSARRNSVMGLSKLFKDKERDPGSPGATSKNTALTGVTQATAEVDRTGSEFPGMTPAAALVHKQKQQYAQQEAAAAATAAAARAAALPTPSAVPLAGSKTSTKAKTTDDATDAKRKAIEKEKEKLKSRKGRKWGFGGSFSASSGSEASAAANRVLDEQKSANENDDRTPRGSVEVLADVDQNSSVVHRPVPRSYFDDDDAVSSRYEELGGPPSEFADSEVLDDYDAASLRGVGVTRMRPRPSREATPKKGILKNSKNFNQEEYNRPDHAASDPRNRSTSFDGSANPRIHLRAGSNAGPPPGTLHKIIPSQAQVDGLAHGHKDAGNSPYSQPSLNASAPILASPSAPLPARSVTSPPQVRRATFAQNLSVHTTWPPAVYDRRAEPATCNRLTPTLAQRIKEELNAYKLEQMEVHASSRQFTHFFN